MSPARRVAGRLLAITTLVTLLAAPRGPAGAEGFSLERYEPTAAGEWTFWTDHPYYSSTTRWAAGLTLDYAHEPLVYGRRQGAAFTETMAIVSHLAVAHLDLAASFADRVTVALSLPITLVESGTAAGGVTPAGTALGDLRVGGLVRLYGQPLRDSFSLSAGLALWLPTQAGSTHAGDDSVRVAPRVVLAGLAANHVLWSATGAIQYRKAAVIGPGEAVSGNSVGTEVQLGAAIAYADLARRFSVGPEAQLASVIVDGHAFARDFTSAELLLGGQWRPTPSVQVGLAAGMGLLREPGVPDARVIARFAWVASPPAAPPPPPPPPPPPADRDGDGVLDHDDLCPDTHQGPHPDPDRPGCPLGDRDRDGVLDPQDQCPDTHQGPTPDPDRPGCPMGDQDGDGVLDPDDRCPTTHQGPHPDPNRLGCPEGDRDGDGVLDTVDACPDVFGTPHRDPKRNGCPSLVEVKEGKILILKPVFFATNKDVILKQSFPVLQAVADVLVASPQIKRVSIEGHTDDHGKPAFNLDLSRRRARSVMKWLIRKKIPAARLEAHGFGLTKPIDTNTTDEGRAKNRRVEFRIVDGPGVKPDAP